MKRLAALLTLLLCLCAPVRAQQTITDDTGISATWDSPFTRIISLYAAHTENLFSLGLDREIIGVSRSEDHPPAALLKPVFSARDGVEHFLAARPDLVLMRPMHARAHPKLRAALEQAGITVLALQPGSLDDMYDYWLDLGRLSGRERQARTMIDRFRTELNKARTQTAAIPQAERPHVFFESIHRKLATFPPGSMPMLVLDAAGGVNTASDAIPRHNTNIAEYGKERILAKGHAIDVYLAQTGTMNRVDVQTIANEPGFGTILAVQHGRVYPVDERLVSRPTFRLLDGIRAVRSLLYPIRN